VLDGGGKCLDGLELEIVEGSLAYPVLELTQTGIQTCVT
jgi:hypothetical protein